MDVRPGFVVNAHANAAAPADLETRLASDDHELLRLWLRLFTCTRRIERNVDAALRREFGATLSRFDLLAQLERAPLGLRMGELSARTMSTGANVTWLVTELERDGLVRRRAAQSDKRAVVVRLTAHGRRHFAIMAQAHEDIIESQLGGLSSTESRTLYRLLGVVKDQLPTPENGKSP